ncbi:hypothetical protein P170DRAFT_469276 [Aspergillus steynii IBT 23096]|uniref:Rhodopsin domain-containing protein n=1 Tax=Aspergillus steynii IBT 23096 TaxID=1392250 RepID=A0A2I2GLN9_9EURO|nr:uncharacterized protein P170DRAFT_469276 [Aspergillus steynii IBT 23096]PLB53791.1 hypothetical protein P170DRAFT_469276 [Aspergillus steynii IBT 23096]
MHNGTDSDAAAMPAPEGEVADFSHPYRYLHTANKVVVIVGLVLSTICLLVRCYTRVTVMRKLLLDDVILVISWVFAVATQALLLYGYSHAGIGIHEWDLREDEHIKSLRVLVAGALLYAPAMGLSKLAIIALYYRFSELRTAWKVTIIGMAIFVTSYLLVIEFLFLFGCRPVAKAWDDEVAGSCVDRTSIFMTGAVASVFTDIILLIIPVPVVARLQMSRRKKAWIFMILLLGSLSVVTSALRIAAIIPLFHSKDQTYLFGKVSLWINVECNLVIICAALPSFRQILRLHDVGSNGKIRRPQRTTSTYHLRNARREHGFTNLSTDMEMDDSASHSRSHPPSRGDETSYTEPVRTRETPK